MNIENCKTCENCIKNRAIYNHACLGCLARHVLIFQKATRKQVMQDFSKKYEVELVDLQEAVVERHNQLKLIAQNFGVNDENA